MKFIKLTAARRIVGRQNQYENGEILVFNAAQIVSFCARRFDNTVHGSWIETTVSGNDSIHVMETPVEVLDLLESTQSSCVVPVQVPSTEQDLTTSARRAYHPTIPQPRDIPQPPPSSGF